ncbi:MAG: hypothetical protein WBG37_00300 [Desulfobacterales bacterium]
MASENNPKPRCFGDLGTVFPSTAGGLRQSPPACMACVFKTECLRTAMARPQGVAVKEETLDRAYAAGMVGFVGRWSRKKELHRQKKAAQKTPKPCSPKRTPSE